MSSSDASIDLGVLFCVYELLTSIQQHDGVQRPPLRRPPELCGPVLHHGDGDGVPGPHQPRVLPLDVQLGGRRGTEHGGDLLPVIVPA